ncbi:MAG: restriction endonuclease, partial [Terriglobia bacterium]
MPIPDQKRLGPRGVEFEYLLADLFRRAGWQVVHQPSLADRRADLVVDAGDKKYVVELKRSAEGRRDRLIPLLSQAILQAQAVARRFPEPVIPVAVIAAPHIPDSVVEQIKDFAVRHASEVGIGVIDAEGLCAFLGHGLEPLSAKRSSSPRIEFSARNRSSFRLFSDLNQWMLKILLSANLPESLLSAPRGRYQNASQLAQAAGVSVMSGFRLVRELSNEGFLDERADSLRLV